MKRLIVLATLGAIVVVAAIGLVYFDGTDEPARDAAGDGPASETAARSEVAVGSTICRNGFRHACLGVAVAAPDEAG